MPDNLKTLRDSVTRNSSENATKKSSRSGAIGGIELISA